MGHGLILSTTAKPRYADWFTYCGRLLSCYNALLSSDKDQMVKNIYYHYLQKKFVEHWPKTTLGQTLNKHLLNTNVWKTNNGKKYFWSLSILIRYKRRENKLRHHHGSSQCPRQLCTFICTIFHILYHRFKEQSWQEH